MRHTHLAIGKRSRYDGDMKISQDYHMHSNFSPDCEYAMAEMCQAAIQKGIPEIGFTEHYDLYPDEPLRDWFQPEAWWQEVEHCRERFAGRLLIRAGIEIGEPHLFPQETKSMLDRLPFDYCLGSLHWAKGQSVFDPQYFKTHTPDVAFGLFFEELEEMTHIGGFDSLSHFDVPVRVGYEVYGHYDPTRYEDQVRPVLRNCIENGIALDINTAALRRSANVLTPGLEILRWYAEMGGERITLGSDAHRPSHVGYGLDRAIETARAAGLTHTAHFYQRQTQLVPL
jgi:histidinol-phosphatase (PHP family)